MNNNPEAFKNRLSEELCRRKIAYTFNSEQNIFSLPAYPKRECPDFLTTEIDLGQENNIVIYYALMTEEPADPSPDHENHVDKLLALFNDTDLMITYFKGIGRLLLIQEIPHGESDPFTEDQIKCIFTALNKVETMIQDLEEDIRDVFERGTYPLSSDPDAETLSC